MEGRAGSLKTMWKNCQRSNLVNSTLSAVLSGTKFEMKTLVMYCSEIKSMFVWYFVTLNIMCYSVDDISCHSDMFNNQKAVQDFTIYLLPGVC